MRRRSFLALLGLLPVAAKVVAPIIQRALVPPPPVKPLSFMGIPVIVDEGMPEGMWAFYNAQIDRMCNPPVVYASKAQYEGSHEISLRWSFSVSSA